jgi:hypothetical protein
VIVVAVGAAILVGAAVTASGKSSPSAARRLTQTCGLPPYATGPELVFGHVTKRTDAEKLRAQAIGEGFVNASIELGCDEFRVVLRGYDTLDIAIALQAEARRGGFSATVECFQLPDKAGELEVSFGHGRDLPTATALLTQVKKEGFVGARLESDPCGGYEVMHTGFSSRAVAEQFVHEAVTSGGFNAHLEPNS